MVTALLLLILENKCGVFLMSISVTYLVLSKTSLINSEIKSDLIYVPSAEERGDICSNLNGGVKAQGEIPQGRLCSCACSCSFAFLGCPIYSSCFRSLGRQAVGCVRYTAAVSGPPMAKIALVSIFQVGEAVDDFRDGRGRMSSQSYSSITEIFIPNRNAVLPIRPCRYLS